MGHEYVKEPEVFSTERNGTVPKPSSADVSNNKVLRADGTWVDQSGGGGGSSTLAGLSDVDLSSPSDSQILQYDNESSKWINVDPPASSSSIETLTDVDLDDLSDGQMLQYDNSSSKWVNVDPPAPPVTGVSDVEVNGESVVNEQGNAEIVSYKEVTQAEYNAMPDSKLTDGVLYCIKDAPSGPDGFPPLIYDTVEREVGVWTDGKPLYQKTVHINSLPSTTYSQVQYAHGILNVDMIVDYNGVVRWASGSVAKMIRVAMFSSSAQDNFASNIAVEVDKTNIFIAVGTNRSSMNADITILYTKTTDTPGSGTWTKQGTLAHHYSTSEQIVGTWTDGKPIYEITYDLGSDTSISYNSWTTLTTVIIANIERIIDAKGNTSSGGTYSSFIATFNSSNQIQLQTSRNGNIQNVRYLTIQYTKSTD